MRPRTSKTPPVLQSVERALRVLETLGERRGEMGVVELARALDLDPTTTYRMLRSLESRQFVRQNPETGRYALGIRLLQLSEAFLDTVELRSIARPFLEELAEETGETVHLMLVEDGFGTYLDRVESNQRVRVSSNVGRREALYASAVGKAILAFQPPERIDEVLKDAELKPYTPNTITDPAVLREHLAEVRSRGYAIDDEEGEQGVRCVGAPIFNAKGEVEAGLSVSAPRYRTSLEKLHGWAEPVMAKALEISQRLGYRLGS